MLVAQAHQPTEPKRNGAGAAAVVEDLRATTHNDTAQRAITREALRGDAGDRAEALDLAAQLFELHEWVPPEDRVTDHDVGTRERPGLGQRAPL